MIFIQILHSELVLLSVAQRLLSCDDIAQQEDNGDNSQVMKSIIMLISILKDW